MDGKILNFINGVMKHIGTDSLLFGNYAIEKLEYIDRPIKYTVINIFKNKTIKFDSTILDNLNEKERLTQVSYTTFKIEIMPSIAI